MQAAAPTQRTKSRAPLPASGIGVPEAARLALRVRYRDGDAVVETTLLELVRAVAEETDDDREVVATVIHMLQSRRVRLTGSFRGCDDDIDAA